MILSHLSALLALGTLCRAWSAEFSEAAQCGTVTVTWSATAAESIGPPFVVRMAAFGLVPLTFNLSESAWSASTRVGSYSFTIPWPEGTQYISAMDDGFGLGTGGISGLKSVKASSNSTCINPTITKPSHIFDVFGSFAQCSVVSMNWTNPATSQTRVRGLVPNGVAFQLDPPVVGARSTTWDLNIKAGTTFALIYDDGAENAMTSPLLQSLASSNNGCLASGAYPSATASQSELAQATATDTSIPSATASSTPSTPDSESNNSRSNLGPILGAVLGALALFGVVGFGAWLRRRKRAAPQTGEADLNSGNVPRQQDDKNQPGVSPQHSEGLILPYISHSGSHQQESAAPNHPRKRHVRDMSRDMSDPSDSSHVYTTGTSADQSTPWLREDDDEPMVIRHEDAGTIIPLQTREVIELPPGYDQLPRTQPRTLPRPLPRPLPPTQAPPQGILQPTTSEKLT